MDGPMTSPNTRFIPISTSLYAALFIVPALLQALFYYPFLFYFY